VFGAYADPDERTCNVLPVCGPHHMNMAENPIASLENIIIAQHFINKQEKEGKTHTGIRS
jgi:hypothetical protein